jgi:hypothetical protein
MPKLEQRIAKMEQAVADVDLNAMTDDELRAHAGTFPMFSRGMYAAILTLVNRHPSAFPVVYDDPERPWVHSKA